MTALVSKNYEIMMNTLSWFGTHTQAQLGYRALEGRFYECNLRPPYEYLNVWSNVTHFRSHIGLKVWPYIPECQECPEHRLGDQQNAFYHSRHMSNFSCSRFLGCSAEIIDNPVHNASDWRGHTALHIRSLLYSSHNHADLLETQFGYG